MTARTPWLAYAPSLRGTMSSRESAAFLRGVDGGLGARVQRDRGHHARQDDLVVEPEHGEFDDLVGPRV